MIRLLLSFAVTAGCLGIFATGGHPSTPHARPSVVTINDTLHSESLMMFTERGPNGAHALGPRADEGELLQPLHYETSVGVLPAGSLITVEATVRAQRQSLSTTCGATQSVTGSIEFQLRDPDGHIARSTRLIQPHKWTRVRAVLSPDQPDTYTVAIVLHRNHRTVATTARGVDGRCMPVAIQIAAAGLMLPDVTIHAVPATFVPHSQGPHQ